MKLLQKSKTRILDKVIWECGHEFCPWHKRSFYEVYGKWYNDGTWEEGIRCLGQDFKGCNWCYCFPKYLYEPTEDNEKKPKDEELEI